MVDAIPLYLDNPLGGCYAPSQENKPENRGGALPRGCLSARLLLRHFVRPCTGDNVQAELSANAIVDWRRLLF